MSNRSVRMMDLKSLSAEEVVELTDQEPFIAFFFMQSIIKEDESFRAAAAVYVQGGRPHLILNPTKMNEFSSREKIGVIIHEYLHVTLSHCTKRLTKIDRFRKIENIAKDMAINQLITDPRHGGWDLPEGCISHTSPMFNLPAGKTSEEYFLALKEQAEKNGQGQEQQQQCSCGSGEGEGEGEGQGSSGKGKGKGKGQSDGDEQGDQGGCGGSNPGKCPNCGKNKGQGKGGGEEGEGEGHGGFDDHGEWSDNDDPANSRVIKEMARKYLKQKGAKRGRTLGAGSQADGIIEEIMAVEEYEIDWKVQARMWMHRIVENKPKFTYKKFSRRYGAPNQGTKTRTKNKVLAIVDTSGSMSSNWLAHIGGQLNLMTRVMQVDVVFVDADVHAAIKKFKPSRNLEFPGRGGTDMQPGFDYAKEENYRGVVCFTDGGLFRNPVSDIPTLWVVCNYPNFKEPFGKVIHTTWED